MSFPLADAIFWIAVACCVVAQAAIVRSAVISPSQPSGSEPDSRGRRAGEIAWAVIPGLCLAVLFVFTWRAMHAPQVSATIVAGVAR